MKKSDAEIDCKLRALRLLQEYDEEDGEAVGPLYKRLKQAGGRCEDK
jgi:hypothetical protein